MADTVSISPQQRRVHVVAEMLAVTVVAPFLIYAATRPRPLKRLERGLLITAAVGTLTVDGWLLYRFWRTRNQ